MSHTLWLCLMAALCCRPKRLIFLNAYWGTVCHPRAVHLATKKHRSGALCTIFDRLRLFNTHQISVCWLFSNLPSSKCSCQCWDFNSKPCAQIENATESGKWSCADGYMHMRIPWIHHHHHHQAIFMSTAALPWIMWPLNSTSIIMNQETSTQHS